INKAKNSKIDVKTNFAGTKEKSKSMLQKISEPPSGRSLNSQIPRRCLKGPLTSAISIRSPGINWFLVVNHLFKGPFAIKIEACIMRSVSISTRLFLHQGKNLG